MAYCTVEVQKLFPNVRPLQAYFTSKKKYYPVFTDLIWSSVDSFIEIHPSLTAFPPWQSVVHLNTFPQLKNTEYILFKYLQVNLLKIELKIPQFC